MSYHIYVPFCCCYSSCETEKNVVKIRVNTKKNWAFLFFEKQNKWVKWQAATSETEKRNEMFSEHRFLFIIYVELLLCYAGVFYTNNCNTRWEKKWHKIIINKFKQKKKNADRFIIEDTPTPPPVATLVGFFFSKSTTEEWSFCSVSSVQLKI